MTVKMRLCLCDFSRLLVSLYMNVEFCVVKNVMNMI